ncbi:MULTISPECIES: hypothetical protein [unclassified Bradyrhizobium]
MPQKPKKVAAASRKAPYETAPHKSAYWSAAYVSFCNGMTVFAVTSGVLGFLLVAKLYL